MSEAHTCTDYFLAANSPTGFVSFFQELNNPAKYNFLLIIKGSPGCGKSTLMKNLVQSRLGLEDIEIIHCSADPSSVDAVIFKDSGICMVDGTSPHVVEPKYVGVYEVVVNLYDCLDFKKLLTHKKEIMEVLDLNKKLIGRSTAFINGASALIGDNYHMAADATDTDKIKRYVRRLIHKEIPHRAGEGGTETRRLLSCIGLERIEIFTQNLQKQCARCFILHDKWGACCRTFMRTAREELLALGCSIITCTCPLAPYDKIEHIFVPELGLGFVLSNDFHKIESESVNVESVHNIHAKRFTDMNGLEEKKQRIKFNIKASQALLSEASSLLSAAKAEHDNLEQYYISACSFSKVDAIAQHILNTYFRHS